MPEAQLQLVLKQLATQSHKQHLEYLARLQEAFARHEERRRVWEGHQQAAEEERRRQARELEAAEAERKQRAEDGVVRAEDGADDEDVADALEVETMGEDEAQSKELVFSA